MESIYDYGARAGFWRLHRMLKDLPVTVYRGRHRACPQSPEQVAAMQAAGWEIASHGLKWIEHKDMSEGEEARPDRRGNPTACRGDRRAAARLVHRALFGQHLAAGGRGGGLRLARRPMPTICPTGCAWRPRPADRALYARCQRHALCHRPGVHTGDGFEGYLKDSFDTLYAEGAAGAPKMLSIGLHCRLAGRPGRIGGMQRALDYMAGA
jgi:peptidoglycan/xylan/chitin deacetylase (PgdA/CDA1 family)